MNALRKTTNERYGSIAVLLHWTVAALFLCQYCAVYYREWFLDEDSPAGMTALQIHQAVGLSVLVFFGWRLWVRLTAQTPAPVPGPPLMQLSARVVHWGLYFFMLAMPVSGYIYAKNPTHFAGLFEIPAFGDTALGQWLVATFELSLKEDIRNPAEEFHKEISGELLLLALIGIHIAAALYHHFIRHDDSLKRMLPGKARAAPETNTTT